MLESRSIAAFLAMALLAAPTSGQTLGPNPLFSRSPPNPVAVASEVASSPSAAGRFRDIGYELAYSENLTASQADQGIILLTAARRLGDQVAPVEPLLLRLATRYAREDYSEQVVLWLKDYVDKTADRVIVTDAVEYLLDRTNAREQRVELLEALAREIGNKHPAIDADLALRLGTLMMEKGDAEAAKFYLVQAYTNNKYNKLAFAKLSELAPGEIGPAAYLEHLRLVLRENPLDINAALNFAQYAERLQLYDLAALSYQYCAELFRYLYPSAPVPPHIYLPWAISAYNTERGQHICLQIAQNVRNMGRFDILLEAIAGKAAARTGNAQEAERILRQAEQRAQRMLLSGTGAEVPVPGQGDLVPVRQLNPKQFAWFYCFADTNPAKALDWANRAYSIEPNSPSGAALLAYALSINNQLEWAKPLLKSFEHTQIADVVQARIELSEGKKAEAIRTLKIAIAKDAGSLAAERAREMLREQQSQYVPPVDPVAIARSLQDSLGQTVAPQFMPPEKMLDLQFSIRGTEFSYGSELEAVVALVNEAPEPLVVTADGFFQGNIRIDAHVTGDIERDIPNLVSRTIRTDLTVPPGRSVVHMLRLSIGELREVLLTHPQASLELQFTLYLDPVTTDSGSVSNRLVDVKPVTISVRRPKVEVEAAYVRSRFNAISSGQQGQKIHTAQLFAGLLKEQYAMAQHGTLYPFRYAKWLPGLLRSAFLANSGLLLGGQSDEWAVKVHAMADMLSMPIDQELATVIAKNLNHPQWPVRLMTVYLLAKTPGNNFANVLDWVAQYDANELVRRMAISLRSNLSSELPAPSPAGDPVIPRLP